MDRKVGRGDAALFGAGINHCALIIKDFELEVVIPKAHRGLESKSVPRSSDLFKQMLTIKPSWSH